MSQRTTNRATREISDFSCDNGELFSFFQDPCWNSDDFFLSCLKEVRQDHEIHPLEDAMIARMYLLQFKTLQQIADYLKRSDRAIHLRLRLFFDHLPHPIALKTKDKEEVCEFFYQRAMKFMSFCRRVIRVANPEHQMALIDPDDDLLHEALRIFLDVPENNPLFLLGEEKTV
jgi:hypothetical protein